MADQSALWDICEKENDPALFSEAVHRHYDAGDKELARRQLRMDSSAEPDGIRKARMQHYVAMDALWHLPRKTSMLTWVLRFSAPVAVLIASAAILFALNQRNKRADLVVYNGYGTAVEVEVAGVVLELEPHGNGLLEDVSTAVALPVSARLPGGEPFETLDIETAGHDGQTLIYNVNGRGVLLVEWVRYGAGEAPNPYVLPPESVQYHDHIHYPFEEPPPARKLADGEVVDKSTVSGVQMHLDRLAWMAAKQGKPEYGVAVALAELEMDRDSLDALAALKLVAAWFYDDEDVRVLAGEVRGLGDEDHEAYQDLLWDRDLEGLRTEYAARLKADPSPENGYLLGRLLEREEAIAHFQSDSIHAKAGLATVHAGAGRFAEALPLYEQVLEGLPSEVPLHGPSALVCARQADPDRVESIVDLLEKADPDYGAAWRAKLAVEGDPSTFESMRKSIADRVHPWQREASMELAMAAGKLIRVRTLLGDLRQAGDHSGDRYAILAELGISGDRERLRRELETNGATLASRPDSVMITLAAAKLAKPANASHIRESVPPMTRGWIPELFDVDVGDADAVRKTVKGHPPEVQAQGWLAASILIEAAGGADTDAWKIYRDEAKKIALPGTLPFWE